MSQITVSGISLAAQSFDDFVKEAYVALSDGQLTFGEIVSLAGSLAGKVSQFESLSGQQKKELILTIVKKAMKQILAEKPELQEKLANLESFVEQTLPVVLHELQNALKNADANKFLNKVFAECKELWHAVSCYSCSNVQEPVKVVKTIPCPLEKKLETDVAVAAAPPAAVPAAVPAPLVVPLVPSPADPAAPPADPAPRPRDATNTVLQNPEPQVVSKALAISVLSSTESQQNQKEDS